MRSLGVFVVMVALVVVLQLLVPVWWLFVVVPFALALWLRPSSGRGFALGFLACLLAWGGLALWRDLGNDGILSYRVAGVFGLASGWMLVAITAVVGGLLGGLSGWAGASLRLATAR